MFLSVESYFLLHCKVIFPYFRISWRHFGRFGASSVRWLKINSVPVEITPQRFLGLQCWGAPKIGVCYQTYEANWTKNWRSWGTQKMKYSDGILLLFCYSVVLSDVCILFYSNYVIFWKINLIFCVLFWKPIEFYSK